MIRNTLYALLMLGMVGLGGCAVKQHPVTCDTESCMMSDGVIRAKRIIIEDDQGRGRIYMGPLTIKGKKVVGIVLRDEKGKDRVMTGTGEDHNAAVVILDNNGKPRIISGSFGPKVGAGTLYLDDQGKHRISIGTDDLDGEAHIEVLDGHGHEVHSFETNQSPTQK